VNNILQRLTLRSNRHSILFFILGSILTLIGVTVVSTLTQSRLPIPYQSNDITAAWIPATVRHWSPTIDLMAKKYNVDPNLIAIIMTMESGGDSSALSQDNAIGLMQVTPPTAKDIARKYLIKPLTSYDLKDPTTNIEFGTAYIAYLRGYFGTARQGPDWNATVELVAAGYNGGPGAAFNLRSGKGLTDTQTVVYSRDAFNMWRERVSKSSPTFDRWKERGGSDLLSAAAKSMAVQK
jgi:soluble lytic murein transglycosylase-like protein